MTAIKGILVALLLVPYLVMGQMTVPAVVTGTTPDFGGTSVTWGTLQFYRPFGLQGILLDDWRNFQSVYPQNGEVVNTDRTGWLPLADSVSIWEQQHPLLISDADTLAPSVLANYRQGSGEFKDFTLWYHNSLGKATCFGWTSKLRSHQRFAGVQGYAEQRHRLQVEYRGSSGESLQVEAGYARNRNPLYLYLEDPLTGIWNYHDELQLLSERWDGQLHWHSGDTLSHAELFIGLTGGIWDWPRHHNLSLTGIAYWGQQLHILGRVPLNYKIGLLQNRLGANRLRRSFFEVGTPDLHWRHFTGSVGVKNIGSTIWLPQIRAGYAYRAFYLNYATRQIVYSRVLDPVFEAVTVQHVQSGLKIGAVHMATGMWAGKKNGSTVSGYHGDLMVQLPWQMDLKTSGAVVEGGPDWLWTNQQLSWEVDQAFTLFDRALYGRVRLWGRHLTHPQTGYLDSGSLQVTPAGSADKPLHLLNYSIQAQVSTLIIGFTDCNVLQDSRWSNLAGQFILPWEAEYSVLSNQLPQSRFQYLFLTWVFDN